MLLRFSIENFLSFYNKVTFDMFPNPRKTSFPSHIYSNETIPVLKQAAIYGANASGKSNFLDAFRFIRELIEGKNKLNETIISNIKYQLVEENTKDITFNIEFKTKGKYYKYFIAIGASAIKEESLYFSGLGKEEDKLIFTRTEDGLKTSKRINKDIASATKDMINKNPFSTIISLNKNFPLLANIDTESIYNWFVENLETLSIKPELPQLPHILSKSKEIFDLTNLLIKELDLGVESVDIKEEVINKETFNDNNQLVGDLKSRLDNLDEESGIAIGNSNTILHNIIKKGDDYIFKSLIFHQLGINDYKGELNINNQSTGTQKLLMLIPALYKLIHQEDYVLLIDELENSIHPMLITAIIKYFGNTDTKGQLIFTTHETELLNQQKYMRPDEVWFTEKHEGITDLYSLNDFKEHNTINIRNGYFEGRYGAIPFIGNLSEIED
ncbi:MAG: ATP/GTP-binding protein [Hyphomicrobiales bacterium]